MCNKMRLASLYIGRWQRKQREWDHGKGSTKLKLFPCLSPDLITAPRWLLVQRFTFGVRHAFKFPSYSQLSFFFFFFLKYSFLFCCLGCSPPGTMLVVAVGRGLFFLHFGLVKRIKITPARLSFTTAVKTWFNQAVQKSEPWESRLCGVNKSGVGPCRSWRNEVTVW